MGTFKGVQNTSGRKAGSVNKTTKTTRELITRLFENNIATLEADFKQLKPSERVNAMLKLMQFIVPTLKAVEVVEDKTSTFQPIQINLNK